MTRPSTGTTFTAGGFNDVDNRFQGNRTGLIAVLVRDARGADTNISPHNEDGTIAFSPLADDGQLRDDLLAFKRVNGIWIENPSANLGFHYLGAFAEGNGPQSKPSLDSDEQMIEQSNVPFDVVATKDDEPFSFTPVETAKPVLRRIRNNLRLSDANGNNLVEVPGGVDIGWAKKVDSETVDRQVLLVSSRQRSGKTLNIIDGYSCSKLVDVGNSRTGKKGEAPELTLKPISDGYFMAMQDGEFVPIVKYTWQGGSAWTDLGTPVPSVYTLTLGSPSAGSFVLTSNGNTTATIDFHPTAAAVKAALVALDDGYDASDWTVTGSAGGPFTITTPSGALTGSGSGLTGGSFAISPVT